MPFVVVEGLTVEAWQDRQASAETEVGGRVRAFDGTMLSSIRARKREWSLVTVPMPRAEADTLIGALDNTPPLSASGDLLGGAVSVHAVLGELEYRRFASGEHVIVRFTLLEA